MILILPPFTLSLSKGNFGLLQEAHYKDIITLEIVLSSRSATHSAIFFMSFLSFHIAKPTGLNSLSSFKKGLITTIKGTVLFN